MRFLPFLLFGLIFFQTQEARTQTLGASSLIYETGDSIILKAIAHFSYPEGCCPAMVAHEIDPGTDTIDVKLYYEVNMCVLGSCYTTPEHIFVGVIPPNTKAAVRLYPMEIYWVDSNVYDTTFMPQLVWTIPFSWVNNIGSESETETEALTVYPNPAGKQILLSFPDNDDWSIIFTDNLGRASLKHSVERGKEAIIDIGNLSPGIYFVTCKSRKISLKKKIIKY